MLEELSAVCSKYGYTVELACLAPGHAWNRTDARIAHMNTFLNALKATSRVFGGLGIAKAFYSASDPELKNRRKYMARSHVAFRKVIFNLKQAAETKKIIGAQLVSEQVDKSHMGVRGFLYYDFSVLGTEGVREHPVGYARVREHADPDRSDNPP